MAEFPQTRHSLVERIGDLRNNHAWSELVDIYGPLIAEILSKKLPSNDVADVVQEILLALARKVKDFDPAIGKFRNWILGFVVRHLMKAQRDNMRRPPTAGSGEEVEIWERDAAEKAEKAAIAENERVWELAYRKRLFDLAWRELANTGVDEKSRLAYWMTAVDEKPPQDVAGELGLSRGAVDTAKCRVKKKLREIVERIEREWEDDVSCPT